MQRNEYNTPEITHHWSVCFRWWLVTKNKQLVCSHWLEHIDRQLTKCKSTFQIREQGSSVHFLWSTHRRVTESSAEGANRLGSGGMEVCPPRQFIFLEAQKCHFLRFSGTYSLINQNMEKPWVFSNLCCLYVNLWDIGETRDSCRDCQTSRFNVKTIFANTFIIFFSGFLEVRTCVRAYMVATPLERYVHAFGFQLRQLWKDLTDIPWFLRGYLEIRFV